MDKISPKLQSLKSTVIAMPGLGMSGKVKLLDGTVAHFVQLTNACIHVFGKVLHCNVILSCILFSSTGCDC